MAGGHHGRTPPATSSSVWRPKAQAPRGQGPERSSECQKEGPCSPSPSVSSKTTLQQMVAPVQPLKSVDSPPQMVTPIQPLKFPDAAIQLGALFQPPKSVDLRSISCGSGGQKAESPPFRLRHSAPMAGGNDGRTPLATFSSSRRRESQAPRGKYFSMIEPSPNNDVLEKCTKDILSLIKPAEDDRNKRQSAIQELEISIQSVAALSGAAVKPFGSFLSNLYSKSGDLDLSVQLINSSNLPISKKRKQTILRELRKALQKRDVARYMKFIPHARVPVLKYVSNHFGISCDLSVDNYPGRIKSRVFYWISTLDERFGDMVLLIKEWAKAQNINDPKTGTLNSYSLCLLVLFHFQTCEPAILPPLKDIYEGNITEDFEDMTLYDEEHLDEVCAANIAKFESQSKEQINESSLCHLLATFFNKFCHIDALSSDVISTYTGKIEKIKDNPSRRMKKSYSLFVEDPVERPDNAARTVGIKGLLLIASAFSDTHLKFVSLESSDRNDLLAMLCTPAVCSKLGGRVIANSYTSTPQRTHQHARPMGRVGAKVSDNQRQRHQGARGSTGSRPVHNPTQVHTDTTGGQTPGQGAKGFTGSRSVHNPTQVHTDTTGRQTPGQGAKGFTGSRSVHNPTQVHTDTTGHQTPGQYRNQDPQFYTNTTGHHYQAPRQPELYQNYYHPPVYTPVHQTTGAYWEQLLNEIQGSERSSECQKEGPHSSSSVSSKKTPQQKVTPVQPPKSADSPLQTVAPVQPPKSVDSPLQMVAPVQPPKSVHSLPQMVASIQISKPVDSRSTSCGSGAVVSASGAAPFDVCRGDSKCSVGFGPSLLEINREKQRAKELANSAAALQHLRPGMVLLKNFLKPDDQVKIIKQCRDLGVGTGGFYQPSYRDGAKLSLRMMCLGKKNWDPNSCYGDVRPFDGAQPPTIPEELIKFVKDAIEASHAFLKQSGRGTSKPSKEIPLMSPDICIVNFYTAAGMLGLHQDKDETKDSLDKKLPVVSFSLGDTAEFLYGDTRDETKASKIKLESGDILIFGGHSRHIFHGVSSITEKTAPTYVTKEANLRPGHLNLTFRQY